jgi:hypothetical protein
MAKNREVRPELNIKYVMFASSLRLRVLKPRPIVGLHSGDSAVSHLHRLSVHFIQ